MIIFKTLSYKNFLSVGNAPIKIDLTKHDRTLICGTNGNGKSTMLSAITFAIFGKPLKNINKPNLVNAINGKNCLVELTFDVGNKEYRVVRGIKPSVFELYENGKLLDQTAVLDYQDYLERHILKTNFRAFTQTSIISIENYVPFMELKAQDRRAFIEDLLDISVFSVMNNLIKAQISESKEKLKDAERTVENLRSLARQQKSHIENLKSEKSKTIDKLVNTKDELEKNLVDAQVILDDLRKKKAAFPDLDSLISENSKTLAKLNKALAKQSSAIDVKLEKIAFYKTTPVCPTCKQCVEEDHAATLIEEEEALLADMEHVLADINQSIKEEQEKEKSLETQKRIYNEINSAATIAVSEISLLNKQIARVYSELKEARADTESIDSQKAELQKIANQAIETTKLKAAIEEERTYQEVVLSLLRDSGIKAQIIKQYVPIINKLVNKFLATLDFFVSFELDENFNESIKSRHRDNFTYYNFSAGERARIDLALMFTFRQIAKLKNSFNCNLLMLDEVLDASLDQAGIDNLFQIFYSDDFAKTNLFVISHRNKDTIADKFSGVITLDKVKNFTEIVQD